MTSKAGPIIAILAVDQGNCSSCSVRTAAKFLLNTLSLWTDSFTTFELKHSVRRCDNMFTELTDFPCFEHENAAQLDATGIHVWR